MAPKGQKRAAPDGKKAIDHKKQRAEVDGTVVAEDPLITGVVEFVQQQENLSENVRNMLTVGIRGSLATQKSERHEVQASFVDMVEEVVRARETFLQDAIEATKADVASGEASKASLSGDCAKAETDLTHKAEQLEKASVINASALEKVSLAKVALAEKENAHTDSCSALQEAQDNKTAVESAIANDFKQVIQGETDGNDLSTMLHRLKFDDSLILALPGTCAKNPTERGPFDTMVLNQLETSLADKLAQFTKDVEGKTVAVDEHVLAVNSAKRNVQMAETEQAKAAEELTAADVARKGAVACLNCATTALAAQEREERRLLEAQAQAVADMNAFQTATHRPFEQLRDSTTAAMVVDSAIAPTSKLAPPESSDLVSIAGGA